MSWKEYQSNLNIEVKTQKYDRLQLNKDKKETAINDIEPIRILFNEILNNLWYILNKVALHFVFL